MAKKASSKKSLKSLFSKSEASLDGTAEKDADRTEGDKKKFKLFKIKTKSRSGSAPEKAATQEQRARRCRYVQDPRLQTLACCVHVACSCFRFHSFDFKMKLYFSGKVSEANLRTSCIEIVTSWAFLNRNISPVFLL